MLALVAAAVFALALLLDLIEANVGDAFDSTTLMFVGLFFLALHLGGIGGPSPANGGWRGRGGSNRRR
ncbi:hypothetical protein [Cellulomonas xiejunii]|uniref:Uncharacterized protein n=1 Tax=Cellulomonas xiejunii TaxID=2968083 RepID=A0ABY5KMV1_9CELL|nr:hypothetical protein [Cellulomonas xiejunii]MCC2321219.1 hypothetical protein [Cellulomonas xiejunii]UUI71806.1 hypothetical protein NP048_18795 [Cellulomonas xiejunii]